MRIDPPRNEVSCRVGLIRNTYLGSKTDGDRELFQGSMFSSRVMMELDSLVDCESIFEWSMGQLGVVGFSWSDRSCGCIAEFNCCSRQKIK